MQTQAPQASSAEISEKSTKVANVNCASLGTPDCLRAVDHIRRSPTQQCSYAESHRFCFAVAKPKVTSDSCLNFDLISQRRAFVPADAPYQRACVALKEWPLAPSPSPREWWRVESGAYTGRASRSISKRPSETSVAARFLLLSPPTRVCWNTILNSFLLRANQIEAPVRLASDCCCGELYRCVGRVLGLASNAPIQLSLDEKK